MKVGRPVVAAAVDAGTVYLDSTGEPPFIRQVFEEFGPRAERTRSGAERHELRLGGPRVGHGKGRYLAARGQA